MPPKTSHTKKTSVWSEPWKPAPMFWEMDPITRMAADELLAEYDAGAIPEVLSLEDDLQGEYACVADLNVKEEENFLNHASSPGSKHSDFTEWLQEEELLSASEIQIFMSKYMQPVANYLVVNALISRPTDLQPVPIYRLDDRGGLKPSFNYTSNLGQHLFTLSPSGTPHWAIVMASAMRLDQRIVDYYEGIANGVDLSTERTRLFQGEVSAWTADFPGCYVLCPLSMDEVKRLSAPIDPKALEVYIGHSIAISGRMRGHQSSGVNALMRAKMEETPFDQWTKLVWFRAFDDDHRDRIFPAKARHWIESFAIIAFQSSVPAKGGLQHNMVDRAFSTALISSKALRKILWVLDEAVNHIKLPFGRDEEAWRRMLAPLLPPGSTASFSTITKAVAGTHRGDVTLNMIPRPQRLIGYLSALGNSRDQSRQNDVDPTTDKRPRPKSARYTEKGGLISKYNTHTSSGQLEKAVELVERLVVELEGDIESKEAETQEAMRAKRQKK